MIVYRICSTKYADNISGESARKQTTNRWNSLGTPMLYTSDSPALCAVEIHQYLPPAFPPKNYSMLKIEIPPCEPILIEEDFFNSENWIKNLATTQAIGDQFIQQNEFLVLKVPSAMISSCSNFLINPNHTDFHKVKIINSLLFPLTGKLFKKQ